MWILFDNVSEGGEGLLKGSALLQRFQFAGIKGVVWKGAPYIWLTVSGTKETPLDNGVH
jgi:hypothetical protein